MTSEVESLAWTRTPYSIIPIEWRFCGEIIRYNPPRCGLWIHLPALWDRSDNGKTLLWWRRTETHLFVDDDTQGSSIGCFSSFWFSICGWLSYRASGLPDPLFEFPIARLVYGWIVNLVEPPWNQDDLGRDLKNLGRISEECILSLQKREKLSTHFPYVVFYPWHVCNQRYFC